MTRRGSAKGSMGGRYLWIRKKWTDVHGKWRHCKRKQSWSRRSESHNFKKLKGQKERKKWEGDPLERWKIKQAAVWWKTRKNWSEDYEPTGGGWILDRKVREKLRKRLFTKYKAEDSKRVVYRDRYATLEWSLVRRRKQYRIRKWDVDCWTRIFSWFREYNFAAYAEKLNWEGRDETTAKNEDYEGHEMENPIKRKNGRK